MANNTNPTVETLQAAYDEALAVARADRTPEARRAAVEASAALSAALVEAGAVRRRGAPASRAGQRQAAERRSR